MEQVQVMEQVLVADQMQLAFDFAPLVEPQEVGETISEQFEAFHRANPHVYRQLRALALNYRRAGQKRCGVKMLFEVLRYQSALKTVGEPWKLNNNYTALYARRLMDRESELTGFFELRERRAD